MLQSVRANVRFTQVLVCVCVSVCVCVCVCVCVSESMFETIQCMKMIHNESE